MCQNRKNKLAENERLVGELDHENELLRQEIFNLRKEADLLRRQVLESIVKQDQVQWCFLLLFVLI